jgi:cytochrome b6-f complex iron-sulfur subunit
LLPQNGGKPVVPSSLPSWMNRTDFLSLLGLGTGAVLTGCLGGCRKDDTAPPSGVDFTLDLAAPANAPLATVGGYVYGGPKNGVLVACIAAGSYAAVSSRCTHQQTTLEFDSHSGHFHCFDHNAEFSPTGTVVRQPDTGSATTLKTYSVVQSGNTIHVTG